VKFLLDTDHITILQQASGPEFAILSARIGQHAPLDFAVSVISFHEQVLGCHAYLTRARRSVDVVRGYGMLARLFQDYGGSVLLAFDAVAASVFDSLVAQRVRVPTMDLRIASVAPAQGLVVLTRNVRDFSKVPGLQTENWTL
jgi:tRNA(fMet)-specific endonuclease VapC